MRPHIDLGCKRALSRPTAVLRRFVRTVGGASFSVIADFGDRTGEIGNAGYLEFKGQG